MSELDNAIDTIEEYLEKFQHMKVEEVATEEVCNNIKRIVDLNVEIHDTLQPFIQAVIRDIERTPMINGRVLHAHHDDTV